MKLFILSIVFLLPLTFIQGQDAESTGFPQKYLGAYIGELTIYSNKGQQKIPMELHLTTTDSIGIYNYTLVYGEKYNRQERPYTLKTVNNKTGDYTLDENNGIVLDCKLVENKMFFLFEVMDNLLTTFITFEKEYLLFEIVVTQTLQRKESGGQNDSIPKVYSYPISVVQKAILNKQ